ncbi:WD40-repeat-containing domain protein [Rhizoctonia solani]|nr:WD40-repeat-containing domain protein [Rhizoctonia solani]
MSTDPPTSEAGHLRHWITAGLNLPSIDHTRPLHWSGLLLCDVSPRSEIAVRLCRNTKDRSRYFNFTPFIVSDMDEETGESVLELPEAAWVVTVRSLTPETAVQLFPDQLDNFNAIEGVYDSLNPSETVKHLFKHALRFASLVAEALPPHAAKVSFLICMKAWDLLDQQTQIDNTVQAVLRGMTRIGDIIEITNQASSSMLAAALNQSKQPVDGILALLEDVSVYIFNRYNTNELARIPLDGARPEDVYDVEAYLVRIEELQRAFYASWSPAAAAYTDNANVNEVVDTQGDDTKPWLTNQPRRLVRNNEPTTTTNPSGYDPQQACMDGRPVGDIQKHFQINCPDGMVVHLQNYDASPDVRAYIEAELGQLAETEEWPDDSISKLCSMAEGIFLWAALAIAHITEFTLPSFPRLQEVLDNHKSPVMDRFDALYMRALNMAMYKDQNKLRCAYLQCIAAILAVSEREPLTVPDLEHLLLVVGQIDQPTLEQIINNLRPFLLGLPGERLKFYHSSFKDFLTDPSRSGEFYIRLDQYNAEPAGCCLKVMQRDLRFNICKLETSHLSNRNVPDLRRRINTHIGTALKYACTHWIDHFSEAPNQALVNATKNLFEQPQLMYWIEVLSLLGLIDVAVMGLSRLASLDLTRFSNGSLIVDWAKDTRQFLLSFYDAVATSAPHLYVSSLALAPRSSSIARRMRLHFPNTVTISQGGDSGWHSCVRSTLHPHAVQSLSISPDWRQIVTAYPDGSLGLWDNQTGACISRSPASHRDLITCVTFSPNGATVASSSHDSTLRVWDITSDLQDSHILTGHSGPVHSVTFSPDGSIIASGSSDKAVRLWTRLACVLSLVSGSWDKTVRVWSVDLGGQQLAANPLIITGHSDSVTCVVLSPDGSKIASGSLDKMVKVWDTQTGDKSKSHTSLIYHSDIITSIAFSPNGKYLASGSSDGAIQLWDGTTSTVISRLFGHFSPVNALAFSPDTSFIVSGSTDKSTRVWEIRSIGLARLVGHSYLVFSVAISSDGSRIVSGSSDNAVRIWDPQTGNQVGNPCTGHSSHVNSVAISPDGAHIVSGSEDKTMKLWNTTTHANVHSYEHSHPIRCTAFSPNGRFIAFGSRDNKVYVWDFAEWKMIKQGLQGHSQLYWELHSRLMEHV